ncbi:MAG: DUF2157 domain-containing protein [Oscillospiraceae bacterium]|nr:DUF2157 domain-containing protein [Oscillospiraceae bacterium]
MDFKVEQESKRWVEAGIISDTQRGEILGMYAGESAQGESPSDLPNESRAKTRSTRSPVIMVVFAIIGSLLLTLGVVLIFASNWQHITKPVKLCVAFLPLLISMGAVIFTLLKRRESAAFREGSAMALAVSVFATIALIEQIFHIRTELGEFIALCMLLYLPVMYILKAKSLATLYIICVLWVGIEAVMPLWFSLLTVVAVLPYFALMLYKADSKGGVWYLTVLTDVLIIFTVFKLPGDWEMIVYKFLICAAAVMALESFILRVKERGDFIKGAEIIPTTTLRPITPFAGLTIIALLVISSFIAAEMHRFYSIVEGRDLLFYLPAFLIMVAAYAATRFYKSDGFASPNGTDVVLAAAVLGLPMFWLWSNLLLLALGVWFIATGAKKYSFRYVNCGMLIIISFIIARFFDIELDLMTRGIVFIIIGAGFMLTNFMLHKKWRKL